MENKAGWRAFQHSPQRVTRPPLTPNNKHRHPFHYPPHPHHRHHHRVPTAGLPLNIRSQITPNVIINRPSRPHTHTHTCTEANARRQRAPTVVAEAEMKRRANLFLHVAQQFLTRLGLCDGEKHDGCAGQTAARCTNDARSRRGIVEDGGRTSHRSGAQGAAALVRTRARVCASTEELVVTKRGSSSRATSAVSGRTHTPLKSQQLTQNHAR